LGDGGAMNINSGGGGAGGGGGGGDGGGGGFGAVGAYESVDRSTQSVVLIFVVVSRTRRGRARRYIIEWKVVVVHARLLEQ